MIGGINDWYWVQIALLVLYLCECVIWTPPNCIVLERRGFHYRFRQPLHGFTARSRAPIFLNPFTLWRTISILHPLPISVDPAHLVLTGCQELRPHPCPNEPVEPLAWEHIPGIWNENDVIYFGGRHRLSVSALCYAPHLAESLRLIWRDHPEHRAERIIELIHERSDRSAIAREETQLHQQTKRMGFCCAGLFAVLFIALPLSIAFNVFDTKRVVILAAALWACSLILFWRSHSRLYPGALDLRLKALASMILNPTAAILAGNRLAVHALQSRDPAAVILLLGDRRALNSEPARRLMRDLLYPLSHLHAQSASAASTLCWFREKLLDQLHQSYEQFGQYMGSPVRHDHSCLRYCPRCESQYTVPLDTCASCEGIRLSEWESTG